MIEITKLEPHEALPTGPRRHVIVMRRLEEDVPAGQSVQIILTGAPDETTHPCRPDGTPMTLDEAIEAGRLVADSEGLHRVFVVDRTQGPRERDILEHAGDHSVHMEQLSDDDLEEGERGPDMRDVAHPGRVV